MTIENILTLLSAIGTICAIVFSALAFSRNKRSDSEEDGKKDGTVFTELGYIKSGVDRIERKQDKQDEQYVIVVSRLSAVEESDKNAHKRITAIEDRVNKEK